jgi:hypothetical protein
MKLLPNPSMHGKRVPAGSIRMSSGDAVFFLPVGPSTVRSRLSSCLMFSLFLMSRNSRLKGSKSSLLLLIETLKMLEVVEFL